MSASAYSIAPLGDHALLLDVHHGLDPAMNRRLHAVRARIVGQAVPGVLDVLVAYASLTVYYDPSRLLPLPGAAPTAYERLAAIVGAAYEATDDALAAETGRLHHLPVVYDGPDLPAVAAALGCTPAEVVALHTGVEYRVFLIGFLPGFPYLGLLPPELELPRKPRPEPVAAGSVAIAGRQTGIYTVDSPGGWHVLGHTGVRLFDPDASPPVLLEPGDRVRFIEHVNFTTEAT